MIAGGRRRGSGGAPTCARGSATLALLLASCAASHGGAETRVGVPLGSVVNLPEGLFDVALLRRPSGESLVGTRHDDEWALIRVATHTSSAGWIVESMPLDVPGVDGATQLLVVDVERDGRDELLIRTVEGGVYLVTDDETRRIDRDPRLAAYDGLSARFGPIEGGSEALAWYQSSTSEDADPHPLHVVRRAASTSPDCDPGDAPVCLAPISTPRLVVVAAVVDPRTDELWLYGIGAPPDSHDRRGSWERARCAWEPPSYRCDEAEALPTPSTSQPDGIPMLLAAGFVEHDRAHVIALPPYRQPIGGWIVAEADLRWSIPRGETVLVPVQVYPVADARGLRVRGLSFSQHALADARFGFGEIVCMSAMDGCEMSSFGILAAPHPDFEAVLQVRTAVGERPTVLARGVDGSSRVVRW